MDQISHSVQFNNAMKITITIGLQSRLLKGTTKIFFMTHDMTFKSNLQESTVFLHRSITPTATSKLCLTLGI